jgi:hypothetical protein
MLDIAKPPFAVSGIRFSGGSAFGFHKAFHWKAMNDCLY